MLYRVQVRPECRSEITDVLRSTRLSEFCEQGIGVRFFGPSGACEVVDRGEEFQVTLAASGLCKRTHYHFAGGQVDEWLSGRHITHEEAREPCYMRAVARHLARFHLVPYQQHDLLASHSLVKRLNYWLNMLTSGKVSIPPEVLSLSLKYCADLNAFLDGYARLEASSVAQEVLCHNDLLPGNIIITDRVSHRGTKIEDRDNESIEFIDYEYASRGYNIYDLANHLVESADEDWRFEHDEEYIRSFVTTYLDELNSVKEITARTATTAASSPSEGEDSSSTPGGSTSDLSRPDELDEYVRMIRLANPLTHYWWGVWGLVQAVNTMRMTSSCDFARFAMTRYSRWCASKNRLIMSFSK